MPLKHIIIIIIIMSCFTQGSLISIHTVLPEGPAIILLPRSSDSGLPAHNVCTFSTPWGSIPARRHFYKRTLANLSTLAFASYRIYTSLLYVVQEKYFLVIKYMYISSTFRPDRTSNTKRTCVSV